MKHDGAPSHRNQESLVQLFGQNLERLATATLSAALDEDPALQEEGALQYLIDVAHMELDSRPGRALGIMQAVMPFADVADVVPGDPVASMLFRALLMLEKDEEVSTILTSLVTSFRSASTVDGAGRAALFLADKARTGLLTLADLQHVRNYIAELQRLPDLVFVPAAG